MRWMDFIFDDKIGPLLALPAEGASGDGILVTSWVFRASRDVRMVEEQAQSVRMMQIRSKLFQETGQGQRPARMVGQPNLDSNAALKTREGQVATPMPSAQVKGGKG